MQFSYGNSRTYSVCSGIPRHSHLGGHTVLLGIGESSGKIGSDAARYGKRGTRYPAKEYDAWPRCDGRYTDSTAPPFSALSEKEPVGTVSPVLLRLTRLWLDSGIQREHDHM